MKQVIQNARGGKLRLKSVPAPEVQRNTVLVRTMASLISAGTERQMVGFAQFDPSLQGAHAPGSGS